MKPEKDSGDFGSEDDEYKNNKQDEKDGEILSGPKKIWISPDEDRNEPVKENIGVINNAFNKDEPDIVVTSEKNLKKNSSKEKPKLVSILELFRYADRIDVFLMIFGTLCACAQGCAMPALMIIFGRLMDNFANSAMNTTQIPNLPTVWPNNIRIPFLDMIRTNCLYFVAIGGGVLFVAYGQVMFWLTTSHRQTNRIRSLLLRSVLCKEIGWFDTHDAGEISTRMSDDINKIQGGIGDKIGAFFQYFSTFVVGYIVALSYGWKLALVIIATCPLIALCAAAMMFMMTRSTSRESAAYAKAGSVAEEVLSAIRTVVTFGGQEKECQRYSENLKDAKTFGIRKSMASGGGMGMTFLVIFCTYALAFWYGGRLTEWEPQNYTIGIMLTVFFCAVFGAMSLGNAAPNIEFIAAARGSAYSIWNIIDTQSNIDSQSEDGSKPDFVTGNIEIVGANFHYPSRPEVKILNGLNIRVMKGQTVALVGSSGCGKSTVIQLIQRFYDPLEGSVMIDGTDIRQLNIKWLRQQIGVVSQEPVLFSTTIAENISYGKDGVTQAEIEQAAREANAHNFISKLPQKYETLVGERGAQLSGGQKQRIAIARALVRDPKILLLDEATSALDTESEATVQAALDKVRQGRTTIVVAHRLSTIKTADIIYGLKDGVVHEFGTHSELMAVGGIYYQLVTNQQSTDNNEDEENDDNDDLCDDYENGEIKQESSRISMNSSLRRKSPSLKEQNKNDDAFVTVENKSKKSPINRVMALNLTEWHFIFFGCVCALIHGGAQPIFGIIFGGFVGLYTQKPSEIQGQIFFYSMMFIVIGVATGLSMFFQFWMFGISGETLTMRIRKMTFKCLLQQEISYFDDPQNSVGAMATRLATDASAVQGATGVRVGMVLQGVACIGTGLIIGFIYSWKFTLFIIGIVPILFVAVIVQMKLAKGFSGKSNKAMEEAGKVVTEAVTNIRTVASLTKEERCAKDYEKLMEPIYKGNLKTAHLFGLVFAILQSMIYFAYAAIFYFGAWLIANDGLNYGSMYKVYIAIIFGAISLGRESGFAPDYGKAKLSAERIIALFDRKTPTIDCFSKEGQQPNTCMGMVEFEDVEFSYPMRTTVPVLRGLCLKVEQGHTIALVGSSGCGKSTTVQLLERFYDIPHGAVKIDGHDVKSLNVSWLRSQLGLVSQEPTLFDCSIRENIAYGDNSRDVTMDEIISAAREANIHSFIESLPRGYDTDVGDKGTQLSGGQKQRIAIARALIRNPKILLLDEATSALDTESEKIVQEALDRAQQGRTSIVIAHRLSTIQNADCIAVFHNGQVAEQGTHSELLSKKGFYYRLIHAQQQRR